VDQASTPSPRDAEFEVLLERVREGSEPAIQVLVDTYGDHVRRVVRRRLNKSLRPKFDSLDFVQSMWASFFEHRSQIAEFDSPEALAGYLARIVSNKVIEQCRRYLQTEKHNVNRERSLNGPDGGESFQPSSPRSTPSEVFSAKEQWQRLLENQPPHYQRMVRLRAEGATLPEIANELGVDEKTVRRVLQRLLKRLEE
jgi:RNA polymerase sigma-70 factor (ECF subfamily)